MFTRLRLLNPSFIRRSITHKDFYIETYGCQMNVSDTQLIESLLKRSGYVGVNSPKESMTFLCNTCSVRQHAEDKVMSRIKEVRATTHKEGIIGLVGCMARKMTPEMCRKHSIDFVVGPDSYRELPKIIQTAYETRIPQICTKASKNETYADISCGGISSFEPNAFISIARGCNNMCSYCVVPYARGKERSRENETIIAEYRQKLQGGHKQITLLGQNVNSYCDRSDPQHPIKFSDLLETLAKENPEVRIRFTSPHPKDFPSELLEVISRHSNICKHIHLPLQSGSGSVLKRMRRGYNIEGYIGLVEKIRKMLPEAGITTDLICGFCDETEEEFEETLSAIKTVQFDSAYTFAYSMRENTLAHKCMVDDVPEEVKKARLNRMVDLINKIQQERYKAEIGKTHLILTETTSRRSQEELKGYTDNGKRCVIPKKLGDKEIPIGAYVAVKINAVVGKTLRGVPISMSSIKEFYANH